MSTLKQRTPRTPADAELAGYVLTPDAARAQKAAALNFPDGNGAKRDDSSDPLIEHPVNYQPNPFHHARKSQSLDDHTTKDAEGQVPSDPQGSWKSSPVFKTLVSGVGFMSDAYDLFIMSLVIVLLSFDYDESDSDKSLITTAVLVGSVLGQLAFGVIADYLGRKKSFIATLSLLIFGAVFSALAYDAGAFRVFYWLAVARFILGIGIGGEYPLSATVSSEASAAVKNRGRRIASVFSMQSLGAVLAPAVTVAILYGRGAGNVDQVWRIALAAGALPAVIMFYFRLTMKESESFLRSHGKEANTKDASAHKRRDLKAYWKQLMGTAGSWFIFDVVFYANGLFASTILEVYYKKPAKTDSDAVHSYLIDLALATLWLSLISLPGYWVATSIIDVIGRRKLQLASFAGMAVTYMLCGATMPFLLDQQGLFYLLYGLAFFCSQGANVVTFVLPAELFPTTIRATAHGISAAAGKIGAAIGGAMMPSILASTSLAGVMFVSAGISALGFVWTIFFTYETMNKALPVSDEHQSSGKHVKHMKHWKRAAVHDGKEGETQMGKL